MLKRMGWIALFLVASAGQVPAQAPAWTLADCQREALRQSWDLKAADARLLAARALARQAGRGRNPDLALIALQDERNFGFFQEVDLWGKRSAVTRSAQAEADAVSIRRGVLEREVSEAVAHHYWQLAGSQKRVLLGAEEMALWERVLDIRQQEVALGAFAQADLLALRETAAERELVLQQVRFDGASAQAALNALLGRQPDDSLVVADALPGDALPAAAEFLPAALQTDPVVREVRARAIAAGYRLEQAQRQWRPDPKVGGVAREEGGTWAAGVQLHFSIPIWDRNRDGIFAAQADGERTAAEVAAVERLAVERAYRAFLNGAMLSDALAHYEAMVLPPVQERLRLAVQGVERGDLSEREALSVQLEGLRRQQEAALLRYRRAEAVSRIDLMMGKSALER